MLFIVGKQRIHKQTNWNVLVVMKIDKNLRKSKEFQSTEIFFHSVEGEQKLGKFSIFIDTSNK